jgi:hypothetical protein
MPPLTTPRRGELLAIAVFAFSLRAIIAMLALRIGHLSLSQYTAKADTTSYIANAAVMCGERSFASLDDYDFRVFPGYPAMIAVTHRLGFSLPMSALLVTWLSAGLAASLAAKAFGDVRVGWAMTCLIPHYLINSSLGMSEAPLLLATCAAILAWRCDRFVLAGAIFAFAGMIRPMACFAFAGVMLAMFVDQDRQTASRAPAPSPGTPGEGGGEGLRAPNTLTLSRSTERGNKKVVLPKATVRLVLATLCAFAAELLLYQLWTGDALRGLHVYANHPGAYNGHLLGWPFQSLMTTPGVDHSSAGRIVYIWVHVVITLGICALCIARVMVFDSRGRKPRLVLLARAEPGLPPPAIKLNSVS